MRLRVISTSPSCEKLFTVIAGTVPRQRSLQLRQHLRRDARTFSMSMKSMMMMPPQVAQPQLPGDGVGGLEVGLEDRVVEVARRRRSRPC